MRAMVLFKTNSSLEETEVPDPAPAEGEVLIHVNACALCRTDLHVIDGELTNPKLPLVPGHEIVGLVAANGKNAARFRIGDRLGVPWLGRTCAVCSYCKAGIENLLGTYWAGRIPLASSFLRVLELVRSVTKALAEGEMLFRCQIE